MGSFREEIARLTAQHFSVERINEKTTKLARELERLINDAPGDTRRVLRRIAEGNLGRLQAPAIEALGGRIGRNVERLTGAIAAASLVIGGAMLATAPAGAAGTTPSAKPWSSAGSSAPPSSSSALAP